MGRMGSLGRWLALAVAVAAAGCSGGADKPKAGALPHKGQAVEVAAVADGAPLGTVRTLRGEWESTSGAEVKVREKADTTSTLGTADVILFPGERLGELVDAGVLAPLPDEAIKPPSGAAKADSSGSPTAADTLDYAGLAPAFRELVGHYGDRRMALPIGGSALVLVYRRDAFASEANRQAAAKAGITLDPKDPAATWDELDALAKFFHGRDWDGDGRPESGIAAALAADPEGVGDAILLARASALGQHPDNFSFLFDADTMAPRIDEPPFLEALKGIAGWTALGPPKAATSDAEAARAAFRSGEVAFLIDRAERATRWTDPKNPVDTGVARLPGSGRVFDPSRKSWQEMKPPNRPSYLPLGGGWLAGLSAQATGSRREAALDFVKFLAGPEAARSLSADPASPMLPVRTTLVGAGLPDPRAALGVDSPSWGKAVTSTLLAERVVPGLRIPEADGYLADLARARAAVASGEPAEKALKDAAVSWNERTKRLGEKRQLWHYRRSLNRLATSSQPPPR